MSFVLATFPFTQNLLLCIKYSTELFLSSSNFKIFIFKNSCKVMQRLANIPPYWFPSAQLKTRKNEMIAASIVANCEFIFAAAIPDSRLIVIFRAEQLFQKSENKLCWNFGRVWPFMWLAQSFAIRLMSRQKIGICDLRRKLRLKN